MTNRAPDFSIRHRTMTAMATMTTWISIRMISAVMETATPPDLFALAQKQTAAPIERPFSFSSRKAFR
jgi:hypothetical protein